MPSTARQRPMTGGRHSPGTRPFRHRATPRVPPEGLSESTRCSAPVAMDDMDSACRDGLVRVTNPSQAFLSTKSSA